MKRLYRAICFLLLASVLFSISVFSAPSVSKEELFSKFINSTVEISGDFSTVKVDGTSYVRFPSTSVRGFSFEKFVPAEVEAPAEFNASSATFLSACEGDVLKVSIDYRDGGSTTAVFLIQTRISEFNLLLDGAYEKFVVDFQWPEGNEVIGYASALRYRTISLDVEILEDCTLFPVYGYLNPDLSISVGALFEYQDQYYFTSDLKLVNSQWDLFSSTETISSVLITEEELVSSFKKADQNRYDSEFGIFFNEDLSVLISAIFLILLFGVLPLILFVIFLFAYLKSKKSVYRALFGITGGLSLATFLVFIILFLFALL